MTRDLKSKTISGFFWSFLNQIGNASIQFVLYVILARLLGPRDFGLIGMIGFLFTLCDAIVNGGFMMALIQKKDANQIDQSSIFYFNIFAGIVMSGAMCLAAPAIAAFYNQDKLIPMTRVLSLNIIINSLGSLQKTLLWKDVNFKQQMNANVLATIMSGIVGLTMAFTGFGVWSLVWQSVAQSFFFSANLWLCSKWRPGLIFSFTALRSMLPYGVNMLGLSVLNTVFNNIYDLLIGKLYSPADLGYYARAKTFQQVPVVNTTAVLGTVLFPVCCLIQDDKARLKKVTRKAFKAIAMLVFPMMIGLYAIAEPLVKVLLTDKWLPCVPMLQLFCILGIFQPLQTLHMNLLKVLGHSRLLFRLELIRRALTVTAIIFTFRFGIAALLCGQIAVDCLSLCMYSLFNKRIIGYAFLEQIQDISPYLGLSLLMGGIISIPAASHLGSGIYLLVFQIVVGLVTFVFFNHLFKTDSYQDIVRIVNARLKKERLLTQA